MNDQEIVCIMCPLGCRIALTIEGKQVTKIKGNRCKQGVEYGQCEVISSARVLTTTVRTGDKESPLLPVRSVRPIPKQQLEDSMAVIAGHTVSGPVTMGQVIISNILGTGVDIVASRSIN